MCRLFESGQGHLLFFPRYPEKINDLRVSALGFGIKSV